MNIKAAFLCIVLALFPLQSIAAETETPTITVTGVGEIAVEPDEVSLLLKIDKFHQNLEIAKRMNDESVAKILALTHQFSIPSRDVRTDHVSMNVIRNTSSKSSYMDDDQQKAAAIKGYVASKSMNIKLRDIGQFEVFYAELIKTGLSEISSVQLSTSKQREHRDSARALAVQAARMKASQLASALGQSIGKAVRISEETSNDRTRYAYANSFGRSDEFSEDTSLFAPGSIKVSASVSVSFELN